MNETRLKIELTVEQVNLCLEALGQLPFARVFALIAQIQDQARTQLTAASARAGGQEERRD